MELNLEGQGRIYTCRKAFPGGGKSLGKDNSILAQG